MRQVEALPPLPDRGGGGWPLIPTANIFGLFTYFCFLLKGIVSRDEYLFNVLEIKLELSIYALKVLQKFWKLADEKVTSQFLLASLKLLTNSENHFSNHHHRPYGYCMYCTLEKIVQ